MGYHYCAGKTYSLLNNKIIRGQRLHNNVPLWEAGGKILKQSTPYECGLVYLGETTSFMRIIIIILPITGE